MFDFSCQTLHRSEKKWKILTTGPNLEEVNTNDSSVCYASERSNAWEM